MDFTTILVLLGLMGTAYSNCPTECQSARCYQRLHFEHVSEFQHTSIAPWNLTYETNAGWEPENFKVAVCNNCTTQDRDMIAEPIYFNVTLLRNVGHGSNPIWCWCPYKLAVGCTCVKKQQQQPVQM